jgi:signal transduction histidine kinase
MNNQYASNSLNEAEVSWMQAESLKPVAELAKRSKPTALLMVVVLLSVMYPYVERRLWLTWLGLHVLSLLVRTVYIAYLKNGYAEKSKYYELMNILIPGSIALTWGSTAYPLLAGDNFKIQILIFNIVLIYGIVGTFNLSKNLKILHTFLTCYGLGLVGSVIAIMIFDQKNEHTIDNINALTLMLLFLFVLNKFGTDSNASHIQTLRLQYGNKLLIDSLTIEKKIAVEAVDFKNRIMASATHDMRQPILALDLYTEMLITAPESLHKLVPKISEATKSVITMFDAMFDLARMSMNQLTPVKVKFNLKEIITALELQYLAPAKDKGLQLRVQYKNSNQEIFDDPILLRRIIGNLISNAIKYTETGGILLVCRDCNKYGLRVEVWDTGVGISPSMQKAVFSEFYKNPENTGTSEGFGLGLSIVAQLCVLLGHKLTMKSRRGHGTVVSIRLSNSVEFQNCDDEHLS